MNTTYEYEGRQVKRLESSFGDLGKLYIDTQYYRDGKRYLSFITEAFSGPKVKASLGMYNQDEVINILRRNYEEFGKEIENYIKFLEETKKDS